MADYSLESMVIRAQHGDHRAFDCLVRRYQGTAVAYARTLLHNPAAAEDAAQEAFVRAWSDLPRLVNPAAFGGWLRRIVFKYCDRARRTTWLAQPLSEALPGPCEEEPFNRLERSDLSTRVHAALNSLPCAQREATLLYYLTGQSVTEIAAFLEVAPSTIKNRLHSARKRLRKELWEMALSTIPADKSLQEEEFAAGVLMRVLREFQRQETADRHTADRSLLDQARKALFDVVGAGEDLDTDAVRNGFVVLWRKLDWSVLSALLMRYLGQPLSDSDMAWAYLHLANALAESGSPAGSVLAHEAFERRLSGKTVRLS